MRRIFLMLTVLLAATLAFGQVPEMFNYQGVLRNTSGDIIKNTNISLQISLLEGSPTSPASYTEDHNVQTNNYGQFAVQIGGGSNPTGSFSSINWSLGQVYLKGSVDETGGTSYQDLPVVQLLTVPFAMYANYAESAENAGSAVYADTTEIAKNLDKDVLYFTDSDTLFAVKDREGNIVFAVFPDGAAVYVNQIAKGKLGGFAVSGRTPSKAGEVDILKVTLDSTRIYVSDTINSKGKLGGFAVSGRTPSKTTGVNDYLVITPDSARIYVNDTLASKGKLGGFAVSGRTPSKNGAVNDYLTVTRDSTRVYITESGAKGKLGGFAVSGRTPSKGIETDYFNISGNSDVETVNSEARIFWYPKKEAFLTGRVLVESADSVGTNSMATGFESKAIGDYSQSMGYKTIARGENSTSIGDSAIAQGFNSYAFGSNALANGRYSFAFGGPGTYYNYATSQYDTVYAPKAISDYSYAFGMGSVASGLGSITLGVLNEASGPYSTAIGGKTVSSNYYSTAMGSATTASGFGSTALGSHSIASGNTSTAMGFYTTASGDYSTAMGMNTIASGENSTAIGGDMNTAYRVVASGDKALAMGEGTTASGYNSIATGYRTRASGATTVAMGSQTVAKSPLEFVIGANNDTTLSTKTFWYGTDPLFIIGNGSNINDRSNAMVVYKNGNADVNGVLNVYYDGSSPSFDYIANFKHGSGMYDNHGIKISAGTFTGTGNTTMIAFADCDGDALGGSITNNNGIINYNTSSDKRLKSNITKASLNGIEIINKIPVVNFEYKKTPGFTHTGFIAQDVQKVFPEAVSENEEGYLQLSLPTLIPVLTKAVQEQQEQIEKIKSDNEELKEENQELKQKLNEIIKLLEQE